jgi:hypothetical protein
MSVIIGPDLLVLASAVDRGRCRGLQPPDGASAFGWHLARGLVSEFAFTQWTARLPSRTFA